MRGRDKDMLFGAIVVLVFVICFFGKYSALISIIGILLLLIIVIYIGCRIEQRIQYLKSETPEQKQQRIHQRRKDFAIGFVIITVSIGLLLLFIYLLIKKLNLWQFLFGR